MEPLLAAGSAHTAKGKGGGGGSSNRCRAHVGGMDAQGGLPASAAAASAASSTAALSAPPALSSPTAALPTHPSPPPFTPFLRCCIPSYRVQTRLGKTFTEFQLQLSTSALRWEVFRRYSEFVQMHSQIQQMIATDKQLKARVKAGQLQLPKLPPSKFHGNLKEEFLQERMRALHSYVQQLLLIEPLHGCVPVLAFMGALDAASASSTSSSASPTAAAALSRLHLDAVMPLLDAGDIVLFRTAGVLQGLQRTFTGSKYDHVGLVIRIPFLSLKPNSLHVLESTSDGVRAYNLYRRLRAWHLSNAVVVVRQLKNVSRSGAFLSTLDKFVEDVEGLPYGLSLGKLLKREPGQSSGTFFCSELVATAYMRLGLIDAERHSATAFYPSSFNQHNSERALDLQQGAELGPEMLVEFVQPAVSTAKQNERAEMEEVEQRAQAQAALSPPPPPPPPPPPSRPTHVTPRPTRRPSQPWHEVMSPGSSHTPAASLPISSPLRCDSPSASERRLSSVGICDPSSLPPSVSALILAPDPELDSDSASQPLSFVRSSSPALLARRRARADSPFSTMSSLNGEAANDHSDDREGELRARSPALPVCMPASSALTSPSSSSPSSMPSSPAHDWEAIPTRARNLALAFTPPSFKHVHGREEEGQSAEVLEEQLSGAPRRRGLVKYAPATLSSSSLNYPYPRIGPASQTDSSSNSSTPASANSSHSQASSRSASSPSTPKQQPITNAATGGQATHAMTTANSRVHTLNSDTI